jgi:hypothetical protein
MSQTDLGPLPIDDGYRVFINLETGEQRHLNVLHCEDGLIPAGFVQLNHLSRQDLADALTKARGFDAYGALFRDYQKRRKDLDCEFSDKVRRLQDDCQHQSVTGWLKDRNYEARLCNNCNKVIEKR